MRYFSAIVAIPIVLLCSAGCGSGDEWLDENEASANESLNVDTMQSALRGMVQMNSGRTLRAGQQIRGSRGARLVMQPDGNFVVYRNSIPLASTCTNGTPGAFAVMQTDGNFVVYRQNGPALYFSNTTGTGAVALLINDVPDPRGGARLIDRNNQTVKRLYSTQFPVPGQPNPPPCFAGIRR